MAAILNITDLAVSYGNIQALRGVDLHVDEGEIIALIGANGAGKSTLMNTIMGLVHPRRGAIEYRGSNIAGCETREIVRQGVTLSPEGRQVFPDLTVMDNLTLGGYFHSDAENQETLKTVFSLFPVLEERRHQIGLTLSGGEPADARDWPRDDVQAEAAAAGRAVAGTCADHRQQSV